VQKQREVHRETERSKRRCIDEGVDRRRRREEEEEEDGGA
jgi:hypothetical protein